MTKRKSRVLIVDDSPFVCGLLSSHLRKEPDFDVVGFAHDGNEAVAMVEKHAPDVVTMDVEMPRSNGLAALEKLMRVSPTPVLMVSGISRQAAEVTLQAIQSGAVDFILKYTPGVDTDPEAFRKEFVSKVRAAAGVKVIRSLGSGKASGKSTSRKKTAESKKHESAQATAEKSNAAAKNNVPSVEKAGPSLGRISGEEVKAPVHHWLIVIGASTGGPIALKELLMQLPPDFPAPILVVQHLPESFTSVLAAQLDNQVPLKVREAQGGESLVPGTVLIAQGNMHLLLGTDGKVSLSSGPKVGGHRPSIDVTMQSAAQSFPGRVDGVLLTGMGDDGVAGLAFIRSKGGATHAQDGKSCVVNGMPQRALDRGVVDFVGTPADIALELNRLAGIPTPRRRGTKATQKQDSPAPSSKRQGAATISK